MGKLWKKDPVWFAVVWIILYVVGFSIADGLCEVRGSRARLLWSVPALARTAAYGNGNNGAMGGFVVLQEQDMENIYRLTL